MKIFLSSIHYSLLQLFLVGSGTQVGWEFIIIVVIFIVNWIRRSITIRRRNVFSGTSVAVILTVDCVDADVG